MRLVLIKVCLSRVFSHPTSRFSFSGDSKLCDNYKNFNYKKGVEGFRKDGYKIWKGEAAGGAGATSKIDFIKVETILRADKSSIWTCENDKKLFETLREKVEKTMKTV